MTWPEFDAEDAKYFIGTWKAVTYISGGEEIPAEMAGPMTFVLNDDGTAQSIEGDEEPYELRWPYLLQVIINPSLSQFRL